MGMDTPTLPPRPCARCGVDFAPPRKRGRPPSYCPACAPHRPSRRVPLAERRPETCPCGTPLQGRQRLYCSLRCANAFRRFGRPPLVQYGATYTCAGCGDVFPYTRRHLYTRTYCSSACRAAAWRERQGRA